MASYRITEESWNTASKSLNNKWSIDMYKESGSGNNLVLEADGFFNSPIDDHKRPYPIFCLEFHLIWNNKFSMEINVPERDPKTKFDNRFNFFIINENEPLYLNLNSININNDVSDLLNSVYDILFPEYVSSIFKTQEVNFSEYVEYWKKMSQEIYPNIN